MARLRFTAHPATVQNELGRVMAKMDVKEHRIVMEGGGSVRVAILFTRQDCDGVTREYRFECETWEHQRDNLRAAQMAITLLWRIFEEYGVSKLEDVMAGFRALPGATTLLLGLPDPYEVLGLPRSATPEEVKRRFRLLSVQTHPDVEGGDAGEFDRFAKAKKAILKGGDDGV